jgi:hypothetical protein
MTKFTQDQPNRIVPVDRPMCVHFGVRSSSSWLRLRSRSASRRCLRAACGRRLAGEHHWIHFVSGRPVGSFSVAPPIRALKYSSNLCIASRLCSSQSRM